MASLLLGGIETRSAAASIAKQKSQLPFTVIARLVELYVPAALDRVRRARLREFSQLVGTVFWKLDELVDLVPDCRDGALNSILVGAGNDPTDSGNTIRNLPVLERLLEENRLERASGAVIDALARTSAVSMAHYVRSWLE
jgi:hypothetical protein